MPSISFLPVVLWAFLISFTSFLPYSIAQSSNQEEVAVGDSLDLIEHPDSISLSRTVFDEFYSSKLIQLRLEGDLSEMIKNKKMEKDVDALLTWTKDDQSTEEYAVEIEARGKSRRKICAFPPIKLKFRPEGLKAKGLSPGYKNYKLVTHCFNNDRGNRNVLKEYLVYKMYNEITDASFRVQLAEIEYVDTGNDGSSTIRYGFLIEHKDELAHRYAGEMDPSYSFDCKQLDKQSYCHMLVFQFMIGNQDWRVKFLHNVKLIKLREDTLYFPVPYDFDYSGLVNTTYARSNPDLPTTSHIERFFMGDASHAPEEMNATIQLYREKKAAIMGLCEQEKLLGKKDRKKMKRYLKSFFQVIKNDRTAAASMPPWDW